MNKSIRWLGSLVLPLFLLLAIWVPTIANAQSALAQRSKTIRSSTTSRSKLLV